MKEWFREEKECMNIPEIEGSTSWKRHRNEEKIRETRK